MWCVWAEEGRGRRRATRSKGLRWPRLQARSLEGARKGGATASLSTSLLLRKILVLPAPKACTVHLATQVSGAGNQTWYADSFKSIFNSLSPDYMLKWYVCLFVCVWCVKMRASRHGATHMVGAESRPPHCCGIRPC